MIMLMLFLEQALGRHTPSLRAPCWWTLKTSRF